MWAIKIFRFIFRFPSMLRLSVLLANESFVELEKICDNKLEKSPKNFIAFFFLFYSKVEQNKNIEAEEYFWKMFNFHAVGKKIKLKYINKIIREKLNNKKYVDVKRDCDLLIKEKNSIELKRILKKILCESNYYLRNFDDVASLCKELKKEFSEDNEILDFTKAYMEAIEIERGK